MNLGKMLGIRREEIMACGDGDNDIAMLKEVGFGVAMANAEEKVKAVADYIEESQPVQRHLLAPALSRPLLSLPYLQTTSVIQRSSKKSNCNRKKI